ncbi:MAG: diaminopimelate decarboxylase [Acidobacteriaceae bacterium]
MNARTVKGTGKGTATVVARPFNYRGRGLYCDGVSLEGLAEAHGTPLYVYSAEQIRYRFGLFQEAFAGREATVCYAVKANSSLAILWMLAELGAGFDIVSGGELERVRRADKAALKRVVFSGAGKQEWEIDAALQARILMFNVESEAELALLAARAEALGVRARFALRVNPDVFAETHPYISTGLGSHKFGVEIGLARAIYRRAARSKWLDAAGVSVHIGSQIRAVGPFASALERVAGLVNELREDGHKIRFVDAGGGLGIDYNDSPTEPKFDAARKVREYAAALGKAAAGLGAVRLLVEPGRFVVAQAGGLLTRVVVVKKNGAKTFVITDAAMNDLIRPALYQAHHEVLPVKQGRGVTAKVDVVGPVCESGDFFAHDRAMAKVKAGELVLVLDAGAYGMSQASNYNTLARAAEVLVDGDAARLIRRRETLRELMAAEIL